MNLLTTLFLLFSYAKFLRKKLEESLVENGILRYVVFLASLSHAALSSDFFFFFLADGGIYIIKVNNIFYMPTNK